MSVHTVAILSPGDMGSGVGYALGQHEIDVITCLRGRSDRTRELAAKARIRDVPSMNLLVSQADVILSILVPERASDLADRVAAAMRETGQSPVFAECNAISPQTTREIERVITEAGGRYVDGGIIGGSPLRGDAPRIYVSGEHAPIVAELDGMGVSVKHIGDEIGRGSGIKMCYAALTKGTATLQIALLAAAASMDLSDELRAEFEHSQPNALKQMDGGISRLPPNAHRWIGEMNEISATFGHLGIPPSFHEGAAEIYRLLSLTPFAQETPEAVDRDRPTAETISAVVERIAAERAAESELTSRAS